MNSTAIIASHLTFIANNMSGNSATKRTCIEAADRLNALYIALGDLLSDKENVNHNCGDDYYCPVLNARRVYCLGIN